MAEAAFHRMLNEEQERAIKREGHTQLYYGLIARVATSQVGRMLMSACLIVCNLIP